MKINWIIQLMLVAETLCACTANRFYPREFHTKIQLQRDLISRQDTLYMLPAYGVVKKRGLVNYQDYKLLWKKPWTANTKITIDSLESRILSRDIDSAGLEIFSKKNAVVCVKLNQTQSAAILNEYHKMIDHFQLDSGEEYHWEHPSFATYSFSNNIRLDRHKRYGFIYIDWQYDQPGYWQWLDKRGSAVYASSGIISTVVTLNFCIIEGLTNNIVFYKYSKELTEYDTAPTSRRGSGLSYRDLLQWQLKRMARHYHPRKS